MKKKLHRKLRQGALNTALCLLCAAACVLTVVAADYLESKYDWQLDYSFNNITTQGEATENLLDSLTRDVRMYAVFSDGSEDSQLIALLNAGHFSKADSVAAFVNKSEDNRLLLAVNDVLNGRYDDYETVAATGERNECCLLLAMKRNDEAMALAKKLPEDEGLTHYLRAICLNRKDDAVGAYDELMKAFELDLSLEEVAKVDGDVNNLLLDKDKYKK